MCFFLAEKWSVGHGERERVRERDGNERRERDDQVTDVSIVRLRERKNGSFGVGTVGYMLDFFF